MDKPSFRFAPLMVFVVLAGILGYQLSTGNSGERLRKGSITSADPMFGKQLPAFSVPVLGGDEVLTEKNFTGKPKLLNIMASWCGPCRMEHTILRDYAQDRQIPIYGIAWKDRPEDTRRFLDTMGNIYAQVGMDERGEAAIALGLTGVPETYLLSEDGKIVALYRGALTRDILEARFDPPLREMRGEKQ